MWHSCTNYISAVADMFFKQRVFPASHKQCCGSRSRLKKPYHRYQIISQAMLWFTFTTQEAISSISNHLTSNAVVHVYDSRSHILDIKFFRPILNLSFLLKVIERLAVIRVSKRVNGNPEAASMWTRTLKLQACEREPSSCKHANGNP